VVPAPAPALPAPASANPVADQPKSPSDLSAAAAPGASTNAPPEDTLPAGTINFPATDLTQVLQIYSELVGRTVLRPTTLPAPTITLKTQTPLTRREAIQAFDAVLALNGIAVVNVGDKFVKVVPTANAGQVGAAFSKDKADQLPDLGQFVTHVVQTTYVKPTELVPALTPFASPGLANGILPIDPSQILVLRDYSENVKRMLEMVKRIDVSVPSEFISEVIPIKYALASDIASALNSVSSGGGGTTVGATTGGTGAGGLRGGTGGGMNRGGTGLGGMNRQGTTGSYPGMNPGLGGATPFGQTQPGAQPGAGSSFSDRLQRIINRAAVSGEITVLGQTKIIADERTNALLIYASRDDMKTIKDIVAKLDVVLAQVLIEAVVVEVTLTTSMALGVSYLETKPHGFNNFLGQGALNNGNLLTPGSFNVISGATNAAGNLPGGFSYLASLGNNDLEVSVTALAANGRARILQRPRIQTSHAVPASIFVGESRPYPQGSYYGGGAFGGYSTIQQLQIGVSLQVTPLINPDGLVVMDIQTEIDSFKGNVTIQGVGDVPITSSKNASAKVAVRDHDTIMLGGLIETDKNSNNSGIPLLKDIPLLGYLFRTSSKDETRSELIVLLRPTVLPTPEVAALAARSERAKMPGISAFEKEVQSEESVRFHQMQRDLGK
jgi:general secretion pathway protein D